MSRDLNQCLWPVPPSATCCLSRGGTASCAPTRFRWVGAQSYPSRCGPPTKPWRGGGQPPQTPAPAQKQAGKAPEGPCPLRPGDGLSGGWQHMGAGGVSYIRRSQPAARWPPRAGVGGQLHSAVGAGIRVGRKHSEQPYPAAPAPTGTPVGGCLLPTGSPPWGAKPGCCQSVPFTVCPLCLLSPSSWSGGGMGVGANTSHARGALSAVSEPQDPDKGHLSLVQGVGEGFLEEVAAKPTPEG